MKFIIFTLFVLFAFNVSAQNPKLKLEESIILAVMPAMKDVKYVISYSVDGGKTWWFKESFRPTQSTPRYEVMLPRPKRRVMFRVARAAN